MIYFVLVASVLGQVARNGAVIELTGQTPTVIYGQIDASDSLTLTRNASEDKLVCSGEFEAADLRILGTSMTVAQMMSEFAILKSQMAHVLQTIAPITSPPASPPPLFQTCTSPHAGVDWTGWNPSEEPKPVCAVNAWCGGRPDALQLVYCDSSSSAVYGWRGQNGWPFRLVGGDGNGTGSSVLIVTTIDDPIIGVHGRSGDAVDGIWFSTRSGQQSIKCGGTTTNSNFGNFSLGKQLLGISNGHTSPWYGITGISFMFECDTPPSTPPASG